MVDSAQMNKSWMEVEMNETICLLRKKLEHLNDKDVEDLDYEEIKEIRNIYETLHIIMLIGTGK